MAGDYLMWQVELAVSQGFQLLYTEKQQAGGNVQAEPMADRWSGFMVTAVAKNGRNELQGCVLDHRDTQIIEDV